MDEVQFTAGSERLLGPVSLAIPGDHIVGIIGPNGAGKSTLLKLLARQSLATAGQVRLDGQQLTSLTQRQFARRVAYLAQDLPPTENLTVSEMVSFGRYPWRGLLGRMSQHDRAKVNEALAMTSMTSFRERRVDTLSGGERQRAWLAMLLAQETDYLLLDEPLAALDVAHQVEVMDLVRRLGRELNLSVVAVLHDINMASSYCDELVSLSGGKILSRGPSRELIAEGHLSQLYGIPMRVLNHPSDARPVAVTP